MKCIVCNKVPLKLEECTFCESNICYKCWVYTKKSCPTCHTKDYKLSKVENAKISMLFSEVFETHSCAVEFQCGSQVTDSSPGKPTVDVPTPMSPGSDELQGTLYNQVELADHIDEECEKSRACIYCRFIFDTIEQFHQHLKTDCSDVKVQCNNCD